MPGSNSVLVKELSNTPTSVVILNQIMNLAVCLAVDPSLSSSYRDVLAGVAASVSLVLEGVNKIHRNG